jgi:protein TonB
MYYGTRVLTVGIGAAAITAGLFLGMKFLIKTDFQVEEKQGAVSFEINPEVEEIDPKIDRIEMKDIAKVEVPPAPPVIERTEAKIPSEPISTPKDAIPTFPQPELNTDGPVIRVIDKDPQPLVRIEPVMPPRADRSGHCIMHFDVSATGNPFNITASHCSQSLFKRASIRSVQGWKYNPEIRDGQAVVYKGLTTRIRFKLSDANGQIIPE